MTMLNNSLWRRKLVWSGYTGYTRSLEGCGSGTQQPILCLCGWCLKSMLTRNLCLGEKGFSEEELQKIRNPIEEKYNWDRIAEQTIEVYEKIINA